MPNSIPQQMFADPDFLKLNESDQEHALDTVLAQKDPSYAKLAMRDRHQVFMKLSNQYHPASPASAELHPAEGMVGRIGDEAERTAGYMGGDVIGSVGGPLGSALAGGVGATAADIDIARRHNKEYGTSIDLSPANVAEDTAANTAGGYIGGKLLGVAGKAATGIRDIAQGRAEFAAAGREAFKKASEAEGKATAKQGAANLAEKTKTYEAAVDAATKSAQQQAAKNQAEIAAKVEEGTRIREDFFTKQAQTEREAAEQSVKLKQKAAAEVASQARAAKFSQTFARGPEAAEAARTESPQARINRKQALFQTITQPLRDFSTNWGERRDALLAGSMDQRIGADTVSEAVERQTQFLAQRPGQTFARPVQKLLDTASGLAGGGEGCPLR